MADHAIYVPRGQHAQLSTRSQSTDCVYNCNSLMCTHNLARDVSKAGTKLSEYIGNKLAIT